MKLRNLIQNPSFEISTAGWSVSGTDGTFTRDNAYPQMWADRGGRAGQWIARTQAAGTTTLLALVQNTAQRIPVNSGQWVGFAALVATDELGSQPGRGVNAGLTVRRADGTAVVTLQPRPYERATFYAGRRIIFAAQIPDDAASYDPYIRAYSGATGVNLAAGQRLWADAVISEVADTEAEALAAVQVYFDGDTPDTPLARYEWDGVPHASTSTATITTIDAHLLDTGAPNPVQIVVQDLAPGSEYTIRGHRGDFTWTVPGGIGTSDGSQIVLIDNRAPLNAPITYTLTVGGASVSTDPLTVTHRDKFIIQSLDGKTQVEYVWSDNGLPRDRPVNSATFNIPGRRRPVVRYETGNDGGGTLEIRTTKENTHRLNQILETGRPIVLRTDGAVRDLDAVETLLITGASNQLWAGDGGTSTQRVWSLEYLLIDDPEPNTVIAAWTWDEFDAVYAGSTWDMFDAEWANQTWNDLDAYEWGQRLP